MEQHKKYRLSRPWAADKTSFTDYVKATEKSLGLAPVVLHEGLCRWRYTVEETVIEVLLAHEADLCWVHIFLSGATMNIDDATLPITGHGQDFYKKCALFRTAR